MAKRSRQPSRRAPPRRKKIPLTPDWPIVVLAGIGMVLTAYLTVVAMAGAELPACGAGSSCGVVQSSRFSTFLTLPMALWGFAVYAAIGGFALAMRPSIARWRRIWLLSLIGLAISVYLTVIGIVELDALCGYCLASLATIAAIFVTTIVRRPEGAPGRPWWDWAGGTAALALVIVGVLHLHYSGVFDPSAGPEDPRLRALAQHLQDTDARFYGAYWCPHCNEQKKLFGASADRLPYVECTPDGRNGPVAVTCATNDINQYPTWIIDGRRFPRVLEPRELARYSGFDWEGFEAEEDASGANGN